MSVTLEVSQSERSPLNLEVSANMRLMSVTPERFGESVALYVM